LAKEQIPEAKPFTVRLVPAAEKYINALDKPTRERFKEKLKDIEADPLNPTHSYPLTGSTKRSSRVGPYRMQLLVNIEAKVILVSDVGPRGEAYTKKNRR
jgi:mRNA-degrading endonuclease RelE of RelBE toxin-antitoxin system